MSTPQSPGKSTIRKLFLLVGAILVVVLIAIGYLEYGSTPIGGGGTPSNSTTPNSLPTASGSPVLSYDCQVNSTGGLLYVIIKNYGNSDLSLSTVRFDSSTVPESSLTFEPGCAGFDPGVECGITLSFSLPNLPENGSTHTLEIDTTTGESVNLNVTAGILFHAGCTYTSSC